MQKKIQEFHDIINLHEFMKCFVTSHNEMTVICRYFLLLLQLRRIIISYPNKCCDLNPLPTVLLKACTDSLLGMITSLVNVSVRTRILPDDFKQVHINPPLKKTTLPKDNWTNYRPVSNLNITSKILEKALDLILIQIICQVYSNLHTRNFILQRPLS